MSVFDLPTGRRLTVKDSNMQCVNTFRPLTTAVRIEQFRVSSVVQAASSRNKEQHVLSRLL